MAKLTLSIIVLLGLFVGNVICGCQYNYSDSDYSGGCANACKDYASLQEAKNACDNDSSCNGITWSRSGIGGSNARDAIGNGWGYQLRASRGGSKSPNKENTWLKGQCPEVVQPNNPCDFQPLQGTYLSGCFNECKDYKTLAEAQNACRQNAGCAGITFSRREIGGNQATNALDGVWGFQLRAGGQFIGSPNGENSWLKTNCPVNNVPGKYCQYTRQFGRGFAQISAAGSYTSEDLALAACDASQTCTGVNFNGQSWQTAIGQASAAAYTNAAYVRGACNVVGYPILFTGCNFSGDMLAIKANIPSIDLKKYKSLYVPQGQYVKFHQQENYQGTTTQNNNSLYCVDNGFLVFLQRNKVTTSSIVVGSTQNKKIKANH